MELYCYVLAAFYLILMAVGIPGNLLVVLVTASRIHKKSVHVFIIALALSDLLACCLLPFGVHYWLYFDNQQSTILCKIHVFTNFLGVFTSMFLTNAIAFDRYFAVCHPLKNILSLQRSYLVCGGCLVGAFLSSVPSVFGFGIRSFGPTVSQCTVTGNFWLLEGLFVIVVFFFLLSTCVLITLYLHMCIMLRRQVHFRARVAPTLTPSPTRPLRIDIKTISDQVSLKTNSSSESARADHSVNVPGVSSIPLAERTHLAVPSTVTPSGHKTGVSSRAERTLGALQQVGQRRNLKAVAVAEAMNNKTTKMLVLSTVVFIASWLPNIVIKSFPTIPYVRLISESSPALLLTIRCFEFLFLINHAVNPFVYSLVNKRFRGVCAQYLKTLRRKLTN